MAFMDSIFMATVQTLGLQQMRCEAAIESAPKALLLQRQRESFVLLHVPLSYCLTGRLVPFTRRMWLRSTNSLSKRPLLIRLSLTRLLLLLPESLGLNLARIRLRLLLIRLTSLTLVFLYPRHLCRGVYSFCLSVRMFVCSFVLPSRGICVKVLR